MIKIDDVSIKFDLGIEKDKSIKMTFIRLFDKKKRIPKPTPFWALKHINLEIQKGEVIGLIGSNGAGKSTLLKLVSEVMKPTSGSIITNGSVSPMIELGAGFDQELTARENIYLNGAILGYSEEFLNEKFDQIVEFSELKEFLDAPIKNFSSGMTAKLAFSVATVVDPEILIVDEILSVGDINFQQKSLNRMKEMMGGGTTVLLVNHNIDVVKQMCNKVVWIEKGQIQKIGDAKQVCDEFLEKSNIIIPEKEDNPSKEEKNS